ncbi:SPFH domain-containing protein [Metasolibacillus meyeri]|uniref:SPFH domain-containing protein n=1 Tax=Metasolibacillus meyeri TaxID=1071052 RepID=A0AAW9NSH5_9BACL|nr:SPFH domain-containing protein [Metasolibacillus meyeri]MEC1178963.1 SPFH domain-containing protein [Metasolibacillus meyeri]
MGLLKAGIGAATGVLADQWREYFYCESISADVLITKGINKRGKRGFNFKGSDNIISNGSIIAINEGQAMIIVDQGQIVEFCAEAGEFVYDTSTEPSIFYGDLKENIIESFKQFGKRVAFGGAAPKDQRIYFFNTKEIPGNKYGTPTPVPFRVIDANIGLDIDISIRCNGEYSFKIMDPILFYTNVSGNVQSEFRRETIDSQLRSELLTALQPAFAKISDMGIRYSSLPGRTMELSQALNDVLSEKWGRLRGIQIISFGVNTVKASEEDEKMIKDLQRNAVLRNPNMAAATMIGAQSDAMKMAAQNEGGAFVGFAGMNMAAQAGGASAQDLFKMGQQQASQQQQTQPTQGWTCSCGATNSGKFCVECGKPQPQAGWTCSCGTQNEGKFCKECGSPRPANIKCDKCGWQSDGSVPKFCPECGDVIDDNDRA